MLLLLYYSLKFAFTLENKTMLKGKKFHNALGPSTGLEKKRFRRHGYEDDDDSGGYEMVCKHSNTGMLTSTGQGMLSDYMTITI